MRKFYRNKQGFTLMEMVMVLVVVGLLVSIIVPKFNRQLDHAKEAATRANLESLRSAVGLYAKQVGVNPPGLSDLSDPTYSIMRIIPSDAWGYSFDYNAGTGEVYCHGDSDDCDPNW